MARLPVKTARGLNPLTAMEVITTADRDKGGVTINDQISLMAYAAQYKMMLNRREFVEVVALFVKGQFDLDKSPSDYAFWQRWNNEER